MAMIMLTVLALFAAPQDVAAEKREVATTVRGAVESVVAVLGNAELTRDKKRASVKQIIDPLIDFRLLAMLSLGKTHWTGIDAKQRDSFTALFIETLQLSYFEKLELFTDEVVEFEEPVSMGKGGASKYYVLTYIVSKGERIKVAYHITKRDGKWKAFDFEIEGVSIRKSYGSQYNDFLKEQSFEQLLETMSEKVQAAKKKNAQAAAKQDE